MSVILYELDRFNKIAKTLMTYAESKEGQSDLFYVFNNVENMTSKELQRAHKENSRTIQNTILQFANDLHRSNVSCWNQQYDEKDEISTITGKTTPYKSKIDLVKALRGVRYNIIENSGHEHSFKGCGKIIEKLINSLQSQIVEKLPEYEQAEW